MPGREYLTSQVIMNNHETESSPIEKEISGEMPAAVIASSLTFVYMTPEKANATWAKHDEIKEKRQQKKDRQKPPKPPSRPNAYGKVALDGVY